VRKHVRVYIEGGAEGKIADSDFRRGWKKFLTELHETARANGYHSLEIVRGKSRGNAFRRFKSYKQDHPDDLCVLLADSETSVSEGTDVWDVVTQREGDKWQRPGWASEKHLYLMVAFVETWLLTDQEALQTFFKQNFVMSPLPTTNLEARSKDEIEQALKQATKNCKNGPYRHGQAHEIIEFVRPEKVKTLQHGLRLFVELSNLIKNRTKVSP
jgi:Domain of unknown function (DUF4276)